MAAKKKYDEDSIEVLDGLSGIRANIGMYLGEASVQRLQAVREAWENALDLYMKGLGNECVCVSVDERKGKQVFTVVDKGPGIPVNIHKKTKESTLTTILTKIHSGSNFDKAAQGKGTSRGKHGVGISACNAVSSHFRVWTCREGKWYTQSFECGKPKMDVTEVKFPSDFKAYGANPKKGTILQFTLDDSIIEDNEPLTLETLESFLYWLAYLNPGFRTRLRMGKYDEEFINEEGFEAVLGEYCKHYLGKKKIPKSLCEPFVLDTKEVSIALQWLAIEGKDHGLSFVNGAETISGGTQVVGMQKAILEAFSSLKKRGMDWTEADLFQGMVSIIHYRCSDDSYAGQNKEKLNSKTAIENVQNALRKPLAKWVRENKVNVQAIAQRASDIMSARLKAKEITKAASVLDSSNKKGPTVSGLILWDRRCPVEERELFLVEGDSAGGSLREARNPYNQGILKTKGKGLNAVRATLAKCLSNAEIARIIIALGGDAKAMKTTGTIEKFSVGLIGLFADADIDGLHVEALWLTVLSRFAPKAFEYGMVYKVNSPLYILDGDFNTYGYTLAEIQSKVKEKDYHKIIRCKGLGEFSSDQLKPFVHPDTRKLTRISAPTKKDLKEFAALMGSDAATRKLLLGVGSKRS